MPRPHPDGTSWGSAGQGEREIRYDGTVPPAKPKLKPNRPRMIKRDKPQKPSSNPLAPKIIRRKNPGHASGAGLSQKIREILERTRAARAARDAFIKGVDISDLGAVVQVMGPKRDRKVNFRSVQGTYDDEREEIAPPAEKPAMAPPACPKPFMWRGNARCGCDGQPHV